MIELHSLRPSQARRRYKRVGRGNSSGKGTTAGRGTKGQRARTGGRNKLTRRGLKHLVERTPKIRGFRSLRQKMAVVTLAQLSANFAEGQTVNMWSFEHAGLITASNAGVKVIGNTELKKKLTVKANKFSKAAAEAITKAGGKTIVISRPAPEASSAKTK